MRETEFFFTTHSRRFNFVKYRVLLSMPQNDVLKVYLHREKEVLKYDDYTAVVDNNFLLTAAAAARRGEKKRQTLARNRRGDIFGRTAP